MTHAILAIDQGTTNTKALLVSSGGAVLASGSCPVGIRHLPGGRVEQDAAELWKSVLLAVQRCLAKGHNAAPAGLALSVQRESVICWSRQTGRPLGPVLGWQDSRTEAQCQQLLRQPEAEALVRRTGLALDPMFSAPKMRWLLDHVLSQGASKDDVCLGTVDSWILWNLTGGDHHQAEAGNAARTLLFSLAELDWDEELLALFGIPRSALGNVQRSTADYGRTVSHEGLPAGIPIRAVMADSHAALFSHSGGAPGHGKATYGTGTSVMVPCANSTAPADGVSLTLAWLDQSPVYAREGNILASGALLDWVAELVDADGDGPGGARLAQLAERVDDSGGLCIVPALSGLGAPYWDREAVGLIEGLTGATQREHLARAALEAVAHQVADVVEAIEADGDAALEVVHADGGAASSPLLMQIQADLFGRPVEASEQLEASALGAAYLALGDVPQNRGTRRTYLPSLGDKDRRAARDRWRRGISRSRYRPAAGA